MSGTNYRGERPAWESHKAPCRAKDLSQTTILEGRTFRAFKCPLFIEGRPTPTRVAQIGRRPGKISPETVSFTRAEFGELQSSVSKILAVLSDLDWWVAGVSNLAKDIQPHLSHNENLQLAGTYSQRYLLESCCSLEELEIQVTAFFSHFKMRERDGYLSRLNSHVPLATRKDLSPLVGEYIFDEELVSQEGNRLQGDVSLKSNTIMLDTLAKRSQDHKVRTLPQPKRPAPALPPVVSNKKPGRGGGKFKDNSKAISPGNPPIGEKAVEQKGRDVPDVRTLAFMKAPEVPPLLVRASDQSPERIAGRLSKFSGDWSEIGADPWVMRIVQWGYKIPFVTLPPLRLQGQETTYPKGSLKWSSLNQSVQELRNKGAIEPAPLTPGFYSRLFLVRKATGEWRPIIDLSSLNVFVHCPSFTMETPRSILRALQQGQWLTSLDLKDTYFHIGIDPADRRYLRFCHNGTVWQFTVLPFGLSTSPRVFTKILKPVLAFAHLHRVKLHMYIDDWLLNPGTHQEALEQTSWLRSLCQKLRLVLNLEKSDLIPSQVATYLGIELDTSVGLARLSHKRLTNWLSVAEGFTAQQSPPAVQWLQVLGHLVSRETSALWSNSHSSHSMAIETPVESVEGEILKTDPTRPSVPPGHPMVDQQGQFMKGSPNRDHRCGVLPVHRQQYSGLGCPLAGINCIWHLVPGPILTTHQCPGASSHMAWPKSFQPETGECEGCAHVRQHVSGWLPEKSGGHPPNRSQ